MNGSRPRKLLGAFAILLVALVFNAPPIGPRRARAQIVDPPARLWRCLAVVGSPLGNALPDPSCVSASAVHLHMPPRPGMDAPIVAPGPPTSLSASVSGHSVVLSWTAPASGDSPASYVLEAGSASGRSDLASSDTGSASPTLTAIDVPSGAYYVRVRARGAAGTSAPSNEIVVTIQSGACATAPGAPAALTAAVNGATLTLTWQAPSGGCAPTAFVIDAGSAPGLSNLASFSTGNALTSFSANGVGTGTYYVRIRSTNVGGISIASNEVQFSIGAAPCPGALGPPTGLTSSVSGSTVVLSWVAPSGAVLSYIVEAGSGPGLSNLVVSDTGSAATTFTGTAGAGTYYVRMRARNACGTSASSNEVTLVVTAGGTPGADALAILVSDLPGNRIVRVTDLNGANWQTGPVGSGRSFSNPWHIALDGRGRIYVADRDNNRIVRMDDLAGTGWKTFSGSGATKLGTGVCDTLPPAVGCVIAVAIDAAGRIYVTASGRVIRMDDMDGTGWTAFSRPDLFIQPKGLIVDRLGRIYVADANAHRIVRFDDMQATGLVTFGSPGSGVGQFNRPEGLALDALGRIYITDNDNNRIVRIDDMSGAGWVTYGSYGSTWSPAGPSTLTAIGQFNEPHDLAVSDSMKIYIIDTGNGRIVRIDDMTGAGWTAFGSQPNQGTCTSDPCVNTVPPGVFQFIAPKGIRLWQGHP